MNKTHAIIAGALLVILPGSCRPGLPIAKLKFPDGKNSVEIPFTRYRGWIIIKATVNNTKTLSFILDTGAPVAVLGNKDLAAQLNLNISGNVALKGSDDNEPRSAPLADDVRFRIGELEITNGLMVVGGTGGAIAGVDGVIGKYLFDDAVVSIDWKESKLLLTKPDQFVYKGKGEVLPLRVAKSGHIYTEVTVARNGRGMKINAIIDSGKRSAFKMDQNVSQAVLKNASRLSNIYIGRGANGPTYGDVTRTDVTLGSLHMGDVVTEIKGTADVIEEGDLHGSIGLGILERLNLVFDYTNQRLILEANEHFSDNFVFSRSGIALDPPTTKEYLLIVHIIPASPASNNGLLKGDRILSINGTKVSDLPMGTVDDLVGGIHSDAIEIEVQRGNETFKHTLVMKSLL